MPKADAFPLTDKVVLLTGAGSGVGRAAADLFAAAGARLALVDIQAEPLRAACDAIAAAGHPAPLAVAADVSSDSDLEGLVKTVVGELGRIDVLVNNAGLAIGGRFQDCDPARLRRVVDVNLYGLLRLTQLVVPVMLEQGAGHIVNVTSTAATLGVPAYAGYSATKAGVAAFTRILRRELAGSGIHLTLFCPGSARTAMTQPMIDTGKGMGRRPHHGPELPAALLVEAVRQRRENVFTSPTPRRQAVLAWVDRLFPRLLDRYWASQTSDEYFEAASHIGGSRRSAGEG